MSFVEPYLSDLEDEVMIGETTRPVSSLKHFAKKVMQLISNKPKPLHVQFKELKAEALSLENASANGQNLSLSPSPNPNPNLTFLKQRESDESTSQSKSIEEIKMVVIEENRETKKEKEEEEEEEEEKSQEVMGEEKENVKKEEEEEGSEKDFAEQKDGQEDEKNDSKEEQEKQEEDEKQNEESEESEEQKEDEGEEKATNQVTVLNEGVDVEKVKKEFESTLTKQNRENLPHIQILKVFTTTPSPTTQLPTTQLPTTQLPTTPNLTVSTVSTSQSYPSPWKKGNNKFKGVRVRLFEGTQERAFSLFANRSPHQRPLFSRHFLRRHFDGGHHRFHLDVASALLSKPIGLTVFSIFPTSQSVGRGGFLSFLLVSDCASSFSTASKAKCRR